MARIHLVSWNDAEARARAQILRSAGFEVDTTRLTPQALRAFKRPPEAFLFDLSRSPSLGRDMGLFIRQIPATRRIPLVFVGGEAAKVGGIRRVLPDASYIEWTRVAAGVRRAIAHPPKEPVVPGVFAPFAGVPLAQKLGIKTGAVVGLVNAPADFTMILGKLPEGVHLRRGVRGPRELTLWCVRSRRELEADIIRMKPFAQRGGLWILWSKRADAAVPDVNQIVVRKTGLANGLVDFKITAVNTEWSGLRFTQRNAR